MRFGEVLREVMDERGVTQSQLARMSGVSRQAINRLIAGHVRDPRLPIAKKLASALGVSLDEIAARMEEDEEP